MSFDDSLVIMLQISCIYIVSCGKLTSVSKFKVLQSRQSSVGRKKISHSEREKESVLTPEPHVSFLRPVVPTMALE